MSTLATGTQRSSLRSLAIAGSVLASAALACSPADGEDLFPPTADLEGAPALPSGGTTSPNAPGGFDDFGDVSAAGSGGPTSSGCPTSVSGVTRDPAGQLPLYNVVVYVPSEPLAPIQRGARCETCDGDFSGRPIAAAVSDAAGKFTLDLSHVPARKDVPLVIQAGSWRRQVTIPSIGECGDSMLPAELTRLPRNRAEGNLPHVAVMRGGSDALECLFTKIGVDPGEFTPGDGGGSIELYYSDLENAEDGTGQMRGPSGTLALPKVDSLFGDYERLRSYDMILLSCEGGDERYDPPDLTHRQNLQRYANEGGRLFGGHFHNGIIDNRELPDDAPEFPDVVKFSSGRKDIEPKLFTAHVNTSFDKGNALADWLLEVGGSSTRGEISINDSERTVVGTLDPSAVSWINTETGSGVASGSSSSDDDDDDDENAALYYGFPTPVGGPACGRMVFTDVHLASGSGDSGKEVFPSCSAELTPQQKALAFLIFDLANCVQPTESAAPPIPKIY
ncbi:MAG TPA: hypothetical protein VFS67_15745 [Polyangiaceae bacterium]|nr:hypothetical protein [Polyangiaceae bacterium]